VTKGLSGPIVQSTPSRWILPAGEWPELLPCVWNQGVGGCGVRSPYMRLMVLWKRAAQ